MSRPETIDDLSRYDRTELIAIATLHDSDQLLTYEIVTALGAFMEAIWVRTGCDVYYNHPVVGRQPSDDELHERLIRAQKRWDMCSEAYEHCRSTGVLTVHEYTMQEWCKNEGLEDPVKAFQNRQASHLPEAT